MPSTQLQQQQNCGACGNCRQLCGHPSWVAKPGSAGPPARPKAEPQHAVGWRRSPSPQPLLRQAHPAGQGVWAAGGEQRQRSQRASRPLVCTAHEQPPPCCLVAAACCSSCYCCSCNGAAGAGWRGGQRLRCRLCRGSAREQEEQGPAPLPATHHHHICPVLLLGREGQGGWGHGGGGGAGRGKVVCRRGDRLSSQHAMR